METQMKYLSLSWIAGAAGLATLGQPARAATAAETQQTGNPYGIVALWQQGDTVAICTLLILVAMSMVSWYVIFSRLIAQSRMKRFARLTQAQSWTADTLSASASSLSEKNPFRFVAEKGLHGAKKHSQLSDSVDFNTWVSMVIDRATSDVSNRMQGGLSVLATVGSTAPFVGLFGTVWGIYHALVKIGQSGQASVDKVAGPVGEALVMTAIGLAVAVPAVLGYNWLVRRNKSLMLDVHSFGADLHVALLGMKKSLFT
jgi:biopolymer transport protein ExbB